jgi:hypothetical protein
VLKRFNTGGSTPVAKEVYAMRLNRWLLGLMMGALCLSYAPAQVVFSFETPDLHGYADDADPSDYCEAVNWNCWQITQSTDGVTDGSYSMRVKWPGGFRWLISSDVRDILPLLRTEQRLLLDITVPAGVSVPWANFIVAFNDDELGWRPTGALQATVPSNPGTYTILVDTRSLQLPSESYDGWFQFNLGLNAGGAHEIYMDNLRLLDVSRLRPAFTFDSDTQGFGSTGASVSWDNGALRIQWGGGFNWVTGGSTPDLVSLIRRGHILVFDITVPSGVSVPWANMIISFSDPAGWRETQNPIELPVAAGSFSIAVDYRELAPPAADAQWFELNLGVNADRAYTILIDAIHVLVEPVPGDVNGDGCVDDADLLAVLFAFGQSGSGLPEDVNGDGVVDDADLLMVLFNFGSGC